MNNTHSKIPPSSAARRMACPGSRAMIERYGRNEESESSQEGTLAHTVAAHWLKEGSVKSYDNVSPYSDEMLEGAKYYEDTIKRFTTSNPLVIEERVDCSNLHRDMWGTPDAWSITHCGSGDKGTIVELHVFDYKFGRTPVDAFENWQLLAYACGIDQTYYFDEVYLHIIQPRDYISSSRHKMWKLTKYDLHRYRTRLIQSEALASSPNAELRVSAECKYCPARHACPALRQAAFGAAEVSHRDVPQGLDSRAVGAELKLLHEAKDLLDYRITALETEAYHLLQSGKHVDYYELKPTESRLNWTVNKDEVLAMGQLLGFDLRKIDTLTPTQAISAGINKETVLKYAERKQSLKLSKIDLKETQAVFGKQ